MNKERKPRKPISFSAFAALALVFVVALLMLVMPGSFTYLFTHLGRFSIVIGFALAFVVCLFFWQLGALVICPLCGYRFLSLQLFNLVIENHHGRPALRWSAYTTFFRCSLVPMEGRATLMRRRIATLSGVFSCLVLSALALALFLRFPRAGFVSLCLLVLWPMALFFALREGIPHNLNGRPTIALKAIRLRAEPTAEEQMEAKAATVMTRLAMGDSLADLPAGQFEIPEGVDPADPWASWLAYIKRVWLLDRGEDAQAHEWLLHLRRGGYAFSRVIRGQLSSSLLVDALVGMPMPDDEAPADAEAVQNCIDAIGNNPDSLMLRYAQALIIQRDENRAERIRERYLRALKTSANVGDPTRCYRRLDRIVERYRENEQHEFSSSAGAAE